MHFLPKSKFESAAPGRFTVTSTDAAAWTREILDNVTGEQWIEYYPYSEDRAPPMLRKKNLSSDLSELALLALSSPDEDDWHGFGAYLSSGAYTAEDILEVIERLHTKLPKKALSAFGASLRIPDTRTLIGMGYEEIQGSYKRYRDSISKIEEITK